MKFFPFIVILTALFFSCEQKKKIDPKFDESLYERVDVNFYKGKKDGKIYIRTGALEMVKDSGNKIVYYFKEIKDLDIASYQTCGQGTYYCKDKNHVYTWQLTAAGEDLLILDGAEPNSFRSFGHHWGKDTNAVYFERTRLANLDPNRIQPVCYEMGVDSTTLYIKFLRDDTHLYFQENEIKLAPGIDITTLSCKDDLFGNSFLSSGDKLYTIKDRKMEIYN
jgi:hypothetical protein